MRVFLDTNVLVSAFTARGLCADLYRLALTRHTVVTSAVNVAEFERVLRGKFRVDDARVELALAAVRDADVVLRPDAPSEVTVRDEDDRWVLAAAERAAVDLLVTGDGDLLAVADAAKVVVVTPREAWDRLRAGPA